MKKLSVRPECYWLLALFLLILPLRWAFSVIFAAAFHEFCHYAVIRRFGIRIHKIELRWNGAYIHTGPMTAKEEILSAFAGPLGGLLTLLLSGWIPRFAFCCAVHSLYNLIPIYPSDGARMLKRTLEGIFSINVSERILAAVKWGTIFSLALFAALSKILLETQILPAVVIPLLLFQGIGTSRIGKKLLAMRHKTR